eukprot:13491642-Heterocapsa_arctica.AAC.1
MWTLNWQDVESVKPIAPKPEGWLIDDAVPEVPIELIGTEPWTEIIACLGTILSLFSCWKQGQ